MREQVFVLPPSVERRKASFSLSKKEEAVLNTRRNWAVSEGKNAEQLRSFALIVRDHREIMHAELASAAENMKPKDAQEALEEPLREACEEDLEQVNACSEASLALKRMEKSPFPDVQDAPLLQWGPGKRSRCRRDNHHSREGNHSIKPNESSMLYRKTVRVQADNITTIRLSTSCHASKGEVKAKNGEVAEIRKDLWSADEKQNQKAMGGASYAKQCTTRSPSRGGRKGNPSSLNMQEQQLLKQSKTCTLADPNLPPKDRCLIHLPGSNNASPSKHELVWPKLVIGLTRQEKEEDFLLFKSTKLPQRPKRRPKVVERALHFCTPGSWLVDISPSRYDVMEKKRSRKRPRGLKAMQSCDSDLD